MSEGQGTAKPLLAVEDLQVSFPSRKGLVEAVRGVSFSLGREKLGIVGESGSGKSMTGRAILRSEEHTSELQSLMRISYAVFCLNKKRTSTSMITRPLSNSSYRHRLQSSTYTT